jgi:TRAP-type C4-dicarboxylate transport system permease small subunit
MHTSDADFSKEPVPLAVYRRVMRFLAGTSMLAIVVIMVVQVFARYVLNASLIWAEELCRYILVWQTFLFIGLAYQRGELVAVEILTDILSPLWRFVLKAIVTVPLLVFLGLMVVNGYSYAARFTHQTLPALDFLWSSVSGRDLGLSVRWVYISVAVGCALLAAHLVLSLVVDARALLAGSRKPLANSAE